MNDKQYDSLKERLAYLANQRNRDGKEQLTCDERIHMLDDLYDASLFLLTQLVTAGTLKGSLSLLSILERSRLEIYDLQRTNAGLQKIIELHFSEPEEDSYFAES
jgi:hypothetical protein